MPYALCVLESFANEAKLESCSSAFQFANFAHQMQIDVELYESQKYKYLIINIFAMKSLHIVINFKLFCSYI